MLYSLQYHLPLFFHSLKSSFIWLFSFFQYFTISSRDFKSEIIPDNLSSFSSFVLSKLFEQSTVILSSIRASILSSRVSLIWSRRVSIFVSILFCTLETSNSGKSGAFKSFNKLIRIFETDFENEVEKRTISIKYYIINTNTVLLLLTE